MKYLNMCVNRVYSFIKKISEGVCSDVTLAIFLSADYLHEKHWTIENSLFV